ASFYIKDFLEMLMRQINIPMLSMAYVVGLIIQVIFRKLSITGYIDKKVIDNLSGTATDLLVAFGRASIELRWTPVSRHIFYKNKVKVNLPCHPFHLKKGFFPMSGSVKGRIFP